MAILATATSSLGTVAVSTPPAFASTVARVAPAEGIFEDCPFATQLLTCTARLATIRAGGFNVVVIPIRYASPLSVRLYATAAQALGISVMWDLSIPSWWQDPMSATSMQGYLSAFAAQCRCSQNGPLLDDLIGFLGSLPATYGYFAADEEALLFGTPSGARTFADRIKQDDPSHPTMFSMYGSGPMAHEYGDIPDMVGQEIYPVTSWDLMPVADSAEVWDSVASTVRQAQRAASRAGQPAAFILQAFSWGDNLSDGEGVGVCAPGDSPKRCWSEARYPSGAEQLQLRNEVLRHSHPSLILWWSFEGTYGQAGHDTSSIYPTGAAAQAHWRGLVAAVRAPVPAAARPSAAQSTAPRRSAHHGRRSHHRRRSPHHRR